MDEGEAKEWMEKAGVSLFFETSAKTAQNIEKMFMEVCNQLLMCSMKKKVRDSRFQLEQGDEGLKTFCC